MPRLIRVPSPRPASARPLGQALEFMQVLWAVAHDLESASQRMRTSVGVTSPQRLVLRLVAHFGQATPAELAAVLHVDRSSLSGVLARLESAGLVARARDPADGRRAILTLTPRGQALNDSRVGTVEESVRRALRRLAAQKVAVAREVLGALRQELERAVSSESDVAPRDVGSAKRRRRVTRRTLAAR